MDRSERVAVEARWDAWIGGDREVLTLRWENGGWTADGVVSGANIHYVLRMDSAWQVRHLMLFRDMEEPDLWLAHDGAGAWGEVNGARRMELSGATDVLLSVTPFTLAVIANRLATDGSATTDVSVVRVDVETLEARPHTVTATRIADDRWRFVDDDGDAVELVLDADGLPGDVEGFFRRVV
ncbi:MAG TPA: putative glycolipid-binding domain-containing protein [Acidimicrobiales bacterium]